MTNPSSLGTTKVSKQNITKKKTKINLHARKREKEEETKQKALNHQFF